MNNAIKCQSLIVLNERQTLPAHLANYMEKDC